MPALIKVHDLRKDGKRRVVDHDTAIRVGRMRIIPAGVKRPYDLPALQPVAGYCPVPHGVVNRFRCIAIIRRFLRLEFVNELPVILIFRGVLRAAHPLGECPVCIRRRLQLKVCLGKAGDRQIKPRVPDVVQLDRDHVQIPAAHLREAVVCQNVRAPLGVRQVFHQHARHLGHALGLRRQHAPMPRDDIPGRVDQHRVDETKLADARPDLHDLRIAVRPGVPRIWHQLRDRAAFQLIRHKPRRFHCLFQVARASCAGRFLFCHLRFSFHWEKILCGRGAAVFRPLPRNFFRAGGCPGNPRISRQSSRAVCPRRACPSVQPVSGVCRASLPCFRRRFCGRGTSGTGFAGWPDR